MHDPHEHSFKKLFRLIQKAERILICAHQKPDGDTLGATTSLFNWLVREQKDVSAFCKNTIPDQFCFLDSAHCISHDPHIFAQSFDLIIVMDSGNLQYCGIEDLLAQHESSPTIVNIDHHPTNKQFGDVNIIITTASSTAEIVARFYSANSIHVDHKMATSILTGLLTDTWNFSNGATNAETMNIGSRMLSAGARFSDIQQNIHRVHRVDTLHLWGRVLDRLRVHPSLDVAVTYILAKDLVGLSEDAESGISNFLNSMLGAHETILVLTEKLDGTVKGSLRSIRRDISLLAQSLGGGGHARAAGFTIQGRIQETEAGPRIV